MVRMACVVRRRRTCWLRASLISRVDCRFGMKRRRVLLLAWLTLLPVKTPLPEIVQRRDMAQSSRGKTITGRRPPRASGGFKPAAPPRQGRPCRNAAAFELNSRSFFNMLTIIRSTQERRRHGIGRRRGAEAAAGHPLLEVGETARHVGIAAQSCQQALRQFLMQGRLGLLAAPP